jgi:hypothetical protein
MTASEAKHRGSFIAADKIAMVAKTDWTISA